VALAIKTLHIKFPKEMCRMFLYLNEYGYKVSKKENSLLVEHSDGRIDSYDLNNLDSLYFAGECRISKSTLEELAKRNMNVVILSKSGKPNFYLFPTDTKPKIINLWEKQNKIPDYRKKILLRHFANRAIKSKIIVLRELARSRKRTNKEISEILYVYANRINGLLQKIRKTKENDLKEFRRVLMGLEGFSAKLYFEALVRVIPKPFGYRGMRTRRPPKDFFNAAISFGYAYLKFIVERALILKGINPYYGILHYESDKVLPFLTFDVMEGFRHTFIDKAVINLMSRKILKLERHAKYFDGGVYINKFGIKILYRELSKKLKITGKEMNQEISYFLKILY
jgi:CRISPR-associated protein Cas1